MSHRLASVAVAVIGCRDPGFDDCAADLSGSYLAEDGARWVLVDRGATLDGYPLFRDVARDSELESAPRAIDLVRDHRGAITGTVTRRYMRGARACLAGAPFSITACRADTLEVLIADPVAPIGWQPCEFPRRDRNRFARWRRE